MSQIDLDEPVSPRLSELVSKGLNVHVHCHDPLCWRLRIMDARELLVQVGDITLEELKGRLRCKCGARPVDVLPRAEAAMAAIRGE